MADNTTLRGRLWNAKRDARNRGIAWRLTDAEAMGLFQGDCYYCGAPGPGGIDRRDNEPFYRPSNAVSCCWKCNRMKSAMSEKQWLAHVWSVTSQQAGDDWTWDHTIDFQEGADSPER